MDPGAAASRFGLFGRFFGRRGGFCAVFDECVIGGFFLAGGFLVGCRLFGFAGFGFVAAVRVAEDGLGFAAVFVE